jgi:hypothetical protein
MEDTEEPKTKPAGTWRVRILGKACGWIKSRLLADVEISPCSPSPEHGLLAASGLTEFLGTISTSSYLAEPPGADPHARWCGRGDGKPPPYPDFGIIVIENRARFSFGGKLCKDLAKYGMEQPLGVHFQLKEPQFRGFM